MHMYQGFIQSWWGPLGTLPPSRKKLEDQLSKQLYDSAIEPTRFTYRDANIFKKYISWYAPDPVGGWVIRAHICCSKTKKISSQILNTVHLHGTRSGAHLFVIWVQDAPAVSIRGMICTLWYLPPETTVMCTCMSVVLEHVSYFDEHSLVRWSSW